MEASASNPVLSAAHVDSNEKLAVEDAKWITLRKLTYTGADNKTRTWETAERLSRTKDSTVDAVGIACILQKSTGPELLLQKQFRPPINKISIEVPAGLFDEGESIETCALRELKEETGYVGEIVKGSLAVSPVMYNDPGFCNTNTYMVHVSVDMSLPENQNPKPELEDNEFIECFSVPLTELWDECRRLEDNGCAIDARVGTIAQGIELAKFWKA